MDKKTITAITLIAALIAIALPILMAVYLSNKQALEAESTLALSYASDVSHRNEIIGDQIAGGIDKIVNAHAKGLCSDDNIERMRQISITSSRVHAFGVVSRDRLICSSVGNFGGGGWILVRLTRIHPIPPTSDWMLSFRSQREPNSLSLSQGATRGYAAVIDKDL
jgi:sensor c-di-GMP phosphodiesterase-like protein